MEAVHRERANSQPFLVPTGEVQSGRRRILGPEEDSDSDEDMDGNGAGPSGVSLSDVDGEEMALDEDLDLETPEHSSEGAGFDTTEDIDLGEVEDDEQPTWGFKLDGQAHPEAIMDSHWASVADIESDFEPDNESDLEGSDSEEEGVRVEDSDGEDSDDEPDMFDWENFKVPGLSAWDQLGEGFEAEAAAALKLSAYDLAICRAFAFKVRANLTDRAFKMTPFAFPQNPPLPTLDGIRSRVNFLAGFKPQVYDCCVNSCLCFVGPHKDLRACTYCKEPRWRANGKPRKKFTYIPLIPRLVAFAANRERAEKQQYRAQHKHTPGTTTDVFDAEHYRSLRKEHVEINGKSYPHKYFEDSRDIALGASWDGFAPFKRRKKTCWPLILFDYNLPPDLRFLLEYIIALGVIPGPNKLKDSDSFLWPLVQELLQLAVGVRAFDAMSKKLFALRAHLLLVFGDIPAVAMFMRMKGHNGVLPCRMCNIVGVSVPGARGTAHYVPLDRSCHPAVQADETMVDVYDAANLPMRTHAEIIAQGKEVEKARSKAEAERLAKKYGVKGVPLLSYLRSLSFPGSFGYDFMHLIWENLMKNLTLLWTGEFKGMDEGDGEYELAKALWEAIAASTASASDTIPSAYGSRIPNIAKDRPNVSAEMWSFWTLYLGPVLLRRKFRNVQYYRHFIKLVRLLNICLQFEITTDEIEEVRQGFISWVEVYESEYFQKKVDRLSLCPLTIHALLHIADGIVFCGPVWCYWAFPMERYCGSVQPGIRSRRFPWASIDRYVVELAQLTQIKTVYNVVRELSLTAPRGLPQGSLEDPSYPTCILLPPHSSQRPAVNQIKSIAAALSTRSKATMAQVNSALKDAIIEEWGKVRRIDSDAGDTMRSCSLGTAAEDSRDSTYVRYEMLVDKNARSRKKREDFQLQTFYGQLTHIYRVHFSKPCPQLRTTSPTTYILAAIRSCILSDDDQDLARAGLDIHFYSRTGSLDVIDITSVQSLIGRVEVPRSDWAIIDRSGALARAQWLGEEDE